VDKKENRFILRVHEFQHGILLPISKPQGVILSLLAKAESGPRKGLFSCLLSGICRTKLGSSTQIAKLWSVFLKEREMTPSEFFQRGEEGSKIRYGGPDSPTVEVWRISKQSMFAYGTEEGTGRRVQLFLASGLLLDTKRGRFSTLELVP
jgi:hypothetical protein